MSTVSNDQSPLTNAFPASEWPSGPGNISGKRVRIRAVQRVLPVLISGSTDLYVGTVARRLGVETWFANSSLEFDSDGNLETLVYQTEQGRAKLDQLSRFCAENGIDIRTVTVVGDGENDAVLFAATGRGILVTRQPPARQGAWRVVAELAEIPALLGAVGR